MPKQTSGQISNIVNEQIKNTEGVKTKDGKNLTLTVQEGKAAEAKINNENPAVVDPNPGNGKPIVSNENPAAVVVDPNPGNGKLIVSNENSAIINNNQTPTQPKPPESILNNVPKPTAPQITEPSKAVVINEKINLENIKPSTEQKSLPAEDIKTPQITEKLNNIQTDSAGQKQNTAAGNDKQAVLNNNKTTSQKIDAGDIDISYTKAQNDLIAVDGAIKTSSVLAESVNGTQNISSIANVSNTTASNPAGNMNNTGSISASTPGEQIIQNLQSNPVVPGRQINISLNPPELGRIRITFQQTDGEITGLLEVEKAQARYDVEKSLPQIIASLQENGVQVQRINVVLDEQSQSNQPKNSFAGDFEGTGKQEFSGETKDNKSDGSKPGSSGSTLDSDFQRARQKVVNEISDDAISAYA
jgi:flagellar hook-length control protein FliK